MGEKIKVKGAVVVTTANGSEYLVERIPGRMVEMYRVTKTKAGDGSDNSSYPVGWTTEGKDLSLALDEPLMLDGFRSSSVTGVCSADLDFCSTREE